MSRFMAWIMEMGVLGVRLTLRLIKLYSLTCTVFIYQSFYNKVVHKLEINFKKLFHLFTNMYTKHP